ncbi:MAG: hypothetical protein U1F16_00050 [Turneriella sp.]
MKRLAFLLSLLIPCALWPRELTLYVTSNLAGRFPLDDKHDENHLLRIGTYLQNARAKNAASYHLDLGNAYYPGRLSRFSFGSLTADYLQALKLDAGLVSSADLNIGAESLDYIRRARGIRLLSANLYRDKAPFFEPYVLLKHAGVRVAVVGITSTKSIVGYAEAQLLDLRLAAAGEALKATLVRAAGEKPDLAIALTGSTPEEALSLLSQNPQLDMILCGSDSPATIGKDPVSAIELPDGRKVVVLPAGTSLVKLALVKKGTRWAITSREGIDVFEAIKGVEISPSFARRMALWQKGYAADEEREAPSNAFTPFRLTPQFAAAALRDTFGCDVAFLEQGDIDSENISTIRKPADVRYAVQNDFDTFTFRLRGDALRRFYEQNPQLVFSGISATSITGYAIRGNVNYRVCSTQRGYEYAMAQTAKRTAAENQWVGIGDAVLSVIGNGVKDPDRSADNRFRLLTILNLSNVYETGRIDNTGGIETPPGQPADSYFKWGLENDVNFLFYNRRHTFAFNPYIFYVRQKDQVIRNLLRGDITYTYNTEWYVKPYQKNRLDTVVVADPVTGLRPSFLRETLGAEFSWKFFTGRFGGGLEKEILDPANDPNWGLEATIAALWEFYPGIKYKLGFDSFSSRTYQNFWRHRVEVGNSLIFTIADPLTFSISHRWYYFYLQSVQNFYNASVLMLSLDVRTTWKYP